MSWPTWSLLTICVLGLLASFVLNPCHYLDALTGFGTVAMAIILGETVIRTVPVALQQLKASEAAARASEAAARTQEAAAKAEGAGHIASIMQSSHVAGAIQKMRERNHPEDGRLVLNALLACVELVEGDEWLKSYFIKTWGADLRYLFIYRENFIGQELQAAVGFDTARVRQIRKLQELAAIIYVGGGE